MDDNSSIHEDFRKILCPVGHTDDLDDDEALLFGESTPKNILATFDITSAYQGQEGLKKG
ncbi:MAG: hypothetical protein ACI9HK_004263 [Pirellulaceae bacterium]|jgi:hypothetical protein